MITFIEEIQRNTMLNICHNFSANWSLTSFIFSSIHEAKASSKKFDAFMKWQLKEKLKIIDQFQYSESQQME
jgi:hypothetical protein